MKHVFAFLLLFIFIACTACATLYTSEPAPTSQPQAVIPTPNTEILSTRIRNHGVNVVDLLFVPDEDGAYTTVRMAVAFNFVDSQTIGIAIDALSVILDTSYIFPPALEDYHIIIFDNDLNKIVEVNGNWSDLIAYSNNQITLQQLIVRAVVK